MVSIVPAVKQDMSALRVKILNYVYVSTKTSHIELVDIFQTPVSLLLEIIQERLQDIIQS